MISVRKKLELLGWCLFDVANSSYTTAIITVFFGRIFQEVIVGADPTHENPYARANFLWAVVISLAWVSTAIMGPFLGAMMDLGRKKMFLSLSVLLCAVATSMLYFAEPGWVMYAALCVWISNIGFSLSENFISSFLPHIADEALIPKLSGWAWGLGYVGGILCLLSINFLSPIPGYELAHLDAMRWVGPITAAFFVLFSVPTFIFVREPVLKTKSSFSWKGSIQRAVNEFKDSFKTIREYQDLYRFLFSFFFVYAGLSIVISFSASYASQVVGMKDSGSQVLFFLLINISAALGAVLFGYVQQKLGCLKTINLTLFLWIFAILLMFFLPTIVAMVPGLGMREAFLGVGALAGSCLGATQSLARSLVGLFSPSEKSGEFFGFWGFSGKLAGVFGLMCFGLLQAWLTVQLAMLSCCVFFFIGIVFNYLVDEKRGISLAHSKKT